MKYLAAFFITAFALAVLAALVVFHGYVLSSLWAWFVVPLFSAPAMTLAMAIGLYCLFRYLMPSKSDLFKKGEKNKADDIVDSLKELGRAAANSFATGALFLGSALGRMAGDSDETPPKAH